MALLTRRFSGRRERMSSGGELAPTGVHPIVDTWSPDG
jgi:hypothetical protein